MKRLLWVGIGMGAVVALGTVVFIQATSLPRVTVTVNQTGLQNLMVSKVDLLQSGDFHVDEVLFKRPDGTTYWGATGGAPLMNKAGQELTLLFPWGKVKVDYTTVKNRLTVGVETTNTSPTDTIQGIHFTPFVLKFPEKVAEYDGSVPLLEHNVGQVAITRVSYGTGSAVIASDDVSKPLMIGLPWALDKPTNRVFPLSIHTNRVSSYPDSYPTIVRPIAPNQSDKCEVSIRFGSLKTGKDALAADLVQKFATTFPQELNWTDRRPIGAIFLATGPQEWTTNPRGWFGDKDLNISTPQGQAEFRQKLMSLADTAIAIMRDMNAQGAITWDIEGQQYRHATTYIGDPRMIDTLAPEMAQVVDEYFRRFRSAGLRTGVCIRPQLLKISAENSKDASQTVVENPTDLLIDKISYARKRWGVSLVYLDSNVNGTDPNPLDVSIIKKLAEQFPDVLLIPEHSNLRYYAYSAPFEELRHGGSRTPEAMKAVYPKAFSAIYTADGPLDLYRDGLRAAVKQGDALMYRTWFVDPQNAKVKELYQ